MSVKSVSRIGVVVATIAATAVVASPSAHAAGDLTIELKPGPFTVGNEISGTAHISSGVDEDATFIMRVFKNGTCAGSALGTGASKDIVSGGTNEDGITFSIGNADAGTYSWQGTLRQGIGEDDEKTTVVCSSPLTVNEHAPNMAVGATNAAAGGKVSAKSVLSNRVKTPVGGPAMSMAFRLYGPADTTCTGTPVFTVSKPVYTSENTYESGDFTAPSAGTYRWKITYSGDGNNAAVTASCGVANSVVTSGGTPPPPAKTPTCQGAPATIVGSGKGETIIGTSGKDVIVAKGGKDVVNGKGGNDLICGGGGNDILRGGGGNDVIRGGDGKDDVQGGQGNDQLYGDGGSDRIVGGPGSDKLYGGGGNDGLDGGKGTDAGDGGPGTDVARSVERRA